LTAAVTEITNLHSIYWISFYKSQ